MGQGGKAWKMHLQDIKTVLHKCSEKRTDRRARTSKHKICQCFILIVTNTECNAEKLLCKLFRI